MNDVQDFAYWMALSHLSNWRTEKVNQLIIEILHNQEITFAEFFDLNTEQWKKTYQLSDKETTGLISARSELASNSFVAESLLEQGFSLIPINSDEYSKTLKDNLKTKQAPPLLYVKGNKKILNEPSVAIVGSRNASEISLEFTRNIAKKCAHDYRAVVSGFAKGIDKLALDASIEFNGHSIIVLPQGILTFSSGFKKYYQQIVAGDVLVVSTFHPKAPWSVGLAMNRNIYIYGLAKEIYVAESDSKGGTWAGVMDGLRKRRKIYVRQPESDEKNANNLLILKGAIPVDMNGDQIEIKDEENLKTKLTELLSSGYLTADEIKQKLQLDIEPKELGYFLSGLDFIEPLKINNKKFFRLKELLSDQKDLFE